MHIFFNTAFTLFGQSVSWDEVIGDITGLLSVWWVAKQNIWTWPIGLVNNVCFLLLFQHAKLFGNSLLQIIFFVEGVYGWWVWQRGRTQGEQQEVIELPVRRPSGAEWIALTVATAAFWPASWALLKHYDDSSPALDSLTTALSLVATYMQAKKMIESWWLWIAVDAISIPLFWSQGLKLTAALFGVFMAVCVVGLLHWQRSYTAERREVAPV